VSIPSECKGIERLRLTCSIQDCIYDAQKILDLCCNLVILDKDTRQFSFIHASIREYLLQLPEYSASAINSLAVERCLKCFMFDDNDSIGENWPNEDKSGDSDRPELSFRRYAICH
jgi:hypothetical protein